MQETSSNRIADKQGLRGTILVSTLWFFAFLAWLLLLLGSSASELSAPEIVRDSAPSSSPGSIDAVELVRRAIDTFKGREGQAKDYAYQEHDQTKRDQVQWSDTYDILVVEGHPYRRHLKFNDQPLPPEEEEEERARLKAALRKFIDDARIRCANDANCAQRSAESPVTEVSTDPQVASMQSYVEGYRNFLGRLYAEAKNGASSREAASSLIGIEMGFKKHLPELRLPLQQLPDGFELRSKGHEVIGGRGTTIIEAQPKGAPTDPDDAEGDARNFNLKIWIDQADMQIVKAEGKAIHPGLLSRAEDTAMDYANLSPDVVAQIRKLLPQSTLRYGRGTVITMEWRKINEQVWLPTKIHIKGTEVSVAPLPQGPRGEGVRLVAIETPLEHEVTFSAFKKFRVETRILSPN